MAIRLEDPPPVQQEGRREAFAGFVRELRAANNPEQYYRFVGVTFPTDPTAQLRPIIRPYTDIDFITDRKVPTGPDRGLFGVWARLKARNASAAVVR